MIICIAGKNDIAVHGTRFILDQGLVSKDNLRICLNLTDDGHDTFQLSFKKFAKNNKLHVCQIEDLYKIKELVLISLEYDRLIPINKFIK